MRDEIRRRLLGSVQPYPSNPFNSRPLTPERRRQPSSDNGRPRRVAPTRPLHIYLNETWHVDAWVNGGEGPVLKRASTWLGDKHVGRTTPDEVRQRSVVGVPDGGIPGVSISGHVKNIVFENCNFDGVPIDYARISDYPEDALVLCFSYTASAEVANRFGEDGVAKKACVEILDFDALRSALDQQVGSKSDFGPIDYITHDDRNHFTKSQNGKWMDEYRLVWTPPTDADLPVTLPPGIAREINIF